MGEWETWIGSRLVSTVGSNLQHFSQVNIVAEVLGSPPQGKFSDTEEYYKLVCPQLLEMLSSEESVVSMIACSSIKVWRFSTNGLSGFSTLWFLVFTHSLQLFLAPPT